MEADGSHLRLQLHSAPLGPGPRFPFDDSEVLLTEVSPSIESLSAPLFVGEDFPSEGSQELSVPPPLYTGATSDRTAFVYTR